MPRLFSIKPSITYRGRKFRGMRGWAGKPSHPPFTDFPIAAYVFGAAFDVISYIAATNSNYGVSDLAHDSFAAGTYVIIGGAILSLAAIVTGFWDWWKGIDREPTGPLGRAKHTQVWRTINWHAVVMLSVTAIVVVDIVVRLSQYGKHYAELPTMILSVVAGLLITFGSFYGGSLVFDYAFNVESQDDSTVWDETEQEMMPEEHTGSED